MVPSLFWSGGCGLVSTDGGRYDVEVSARVRRPVYWDSSQGDAVRRCSWYRQGALDLTPQPYEEEVSAQLEVSLDLEHFTDFLRYMQFLFNMLKHACLYS